ncbi:hypothetical protein LINPERHAP2_LOCUS15639 [Linum perenne]
MTIFSRTNQTRSRSKKAYIGLRPSPPSTEETNKSGKFKFIDEVEAFHKDG